jgi:4-amino-4-deoxy-L-arabinose transferase-like glycosyltransferase
MQLKKIHPEILGLFILLAIGLRFFSFYPMVIDHDESTYLVIAQEMLKGKIYWVDLFDTKPPGIFIVYSVLIGIAGKSIFFIRLLVAVWIALTAWGIFHLSKKWLSTGPGPWFAGVAYIVMTSMFTYFGVSPNTELFFAGFSVLALLIVWHYPWQWVAFVLAGLSLGIGLAIKQVVLFDALPLGLFLLWRIIQDRVHIMERLLKLGVLTLCSFIPTLAIAFWYYNQGYWEQFYFHQFVVPGRYPADNEWWDMTKFFIDYFIRFFPITILVLYVLIKTRRMAIPELAFLKLWAGFTILAAVIPGNIFYHYYIQAMPPFVLLAGFAFHPDIPREGIWQRVLSTRSGWIVLGLLSVITIYFQKKDYFDKPDHRRFIHNYIKEKKQKDVSIYTGDGHYQILYFSLNDDPPVAYPHPSLLWKDKHQENFEMDVDAEYKKVMDEKPDYCIFDARRDHGIFDPFLAKYYDVVDTFNREVVFYEIKGRF